MQLKVTKINKNKETAYQVRDENNTLIYIINNLKKIFGHKLALLDINKNNLCQVKASTVKKFTFTEKNKPTDIMSISKKTSPTIDYHLEKNNWKIEVNITYTDFNIYDETTKKIAYVNYNLPDNSWIVNINDKTKINLTMSILMAIMIISQN